MITVFTARSIITMNPSQPRATAVAVRDDRIIDPVLVGGEPGRHGCQRAYLDDAVFTHGYRRGPWQ